MMPTETCLSRMEDGFDSRRRYKIKRPTNPFSRSFFIILSTMPVSPLFGRGLGEASLYAIASELTRLSL